MKKIFGIILAIIVVVGGVFFIISGFKSISNKRYFSHGTGVISSIECEDSIDDSGEYRVMVKYTIDGTEYESPFDQYRAGMQIGDEIEFIYDLNNPQTISSGSVLSIVILFAVGIVAIIAGATVFIRKIR